MKLSPAYHLRTNKAVERLLFVELLTKIDASLTDGIGHYRYVGMGGPYLEDFALIHGTFGNRDLMSLEIKANVKSRQKINTPCSRITLTLDSSEKFVAQYQTSDTPQIVWFDYEWQNWHEQISESCDLLQKLPPMSIFKITLTGGTEWLEAEGDKEARPESEALVNRAAILSSLFPETGPFVAEQIKRETVCATLHKICRHAIAEAVPDTAFKSVRTLAAYEYDDGTPVLTITMIVGPLKLVEELVAKARLARWPYSVLDWKIAKKIAVPYLGLRERLAVDKLLPDANAREVVKRLKLHLGKNYAESVAAMRNYLEFYRYVPHFLRISV